MGWYGNGVGWVGWITMTLLMVSFWAVVVFAVIAMFRGSGAGGQSSRPLGQRTPMDVLEERFARGEIDAEELRTRAEILRHKDR
ncbi:SHOCT domain-containing protein [Nocardioides sp. CF8]|uniref:SHOCT domain-containing protein n=1 Tax=Nocardioides sp. CF8 TaxID=110319 RepID=UPI000687A4B1|nr:hypothetical protein [Nocardioides sp. CF8]